MPGKATVTPIERPDQGPLRLNLGAGDTPIEGYRNLDRKGGQEVYPLDYSDESVDEIRASHILEHFSHRQVDEVLRDWVRALKPGGLLQVAVPDFETIARAYLGGAQLPVEGYVMGGHVDEDDRHGAIFDQEELGDRMRRAGLLGLTRWVSQAGDCASLPVSLNLQGYKPPATWPRTVAVMSTPRLGFMDNHLCAFEAIVPLRIGLVRHTGAFWGQCLTRAIEQSLEDTAVEFILTLDYDSVYTRNDVEGLLSAALRHPEADAIAALQASRTKPTPLMTLANEAGENVAEVERRHFDPELVRAKTAHFGLTLLRAAALRGLPRPWFHGTPGADGRWGDDRTDDDIAFWRAWERAGRSLYVASRVPIGHAELMVRWPGRDLQAIYQHPSEFWRDGKPEDVWR